MKNERIVVNSGAGFSWLAHIVGHNGENVTRVMLSSIVRTITDTVTGEAVVDTLSIATVLFDTMQQNPVVWGPTDNPTPFNFKDDIPHTKIVNRYRYTLQYTFTPISGAVFKTREIDVLGD